MENLSPNPSIQNAEDLEEEPLENLPQEERIAQIKRARSIVNRFSLFKNIEQNSVKPEETDKLLDEFLSSEKLIDRVLTHAEKLLNDPRQGRGALETVFMVFEGLNEVVDADAIRVFNRNGEKSKQAAQKYFDITTNHLGLIREVIKTDPRALASIEGMRALAAVVEFGTDNQQMVAREVVGNLSPIVIEQLTNLSQPLGELEPLIDVLLEKSDRPTRERVKQALVAHYIKSGGDSDVLRKSWAKKFESQDYRDIVEEILFPTLVKCGLSEHKKEIWDIWEEAIYGGYSRNLESTLKAMNEIENRAPGAVRYLYQEYGIANFGRYPVEMMIAQYEHRDDTETPYGTAMYPYFDDNGAFYGDVNVLDSLMKQLGGRRLIRVAEVGRKVQIARLLRRLDAKYGKNHKIEFAILGAHGALDSSSLSSQSIDESSQLNRDWNNTAIGLLDLVVANEDTNKRPAERMQNYKEFFVEHPSIIFASCSTGIEGGWAQEFSRVFNATVVAPDSRTSPREMMASEDDRGLLQLDVMYSQGKSMKYDRGVLVEPNSEG